MAYTAENLEHAVSVFYSSEHSDRADAHKWLTEAQRCPEAWSFVWELLNSQKGTEIQFFAATTLHTKLQRCWSEVPPDKYEELKNRIMQAISMFSNGPKIVLNRLCISLAAFILQQGGRGVLEIVQQLSSAQSPSLLLEILSVLPEEFLNMIMPASDRCVVRTNLQLLTNQILELVIKHLNVESKSFNESNWLWQVSIWQAACQCASAWIQLGGVIPIECIPVVTAALQVLFVVYRGLIVSGEGRRSELCQSEIEACEAALNVAGAALTQPDASQHPTSCSHLLRLLLNVSEPILQAEDTLHTLNEDLVVAVYSTLVAAGEFHARWVALSLIEDDVSSPTNQNISHNPSREEMIQSRREQMRCASDLLRLLLCCSGAAGVYPIQESHSKLAFGFWFSLQDEGLWNGGENSNTSQKVKVALRPWYEQLVGILLRKSTIPPPPTELSAVDDELMRCYRQDVADTLVYCHTVLGNSLVLQLENLMTNLVKNCLSDRGCNLEAVLHAFLALAEFVTFSVSNSLFGLMKVLIELPYDDLHQQVIITALGCFVAYAEWLSSVQDPAAEEIVGRALNVTWSAIDKKELTSLGVLALKAFCQECNNYLKPHAHQLLQAIQAGQSKWVNVVSTQVMMAAGCTAATLTVSEAAPYLTNLVTPIVAKLQAAQKPQLSARKIVSCTSALHQATALIGALTKTDVKHVYTPLSLLLPTFGYLVQHPKLTEPLFKLIKSVIIKLQDDCIPLLPDIIRATSTSLEVEPQSSTIEVCKLISLMFPEVGEDTFKIAVSSVLKVCGETVSQGQSLSTHAPLLDSFYSSLGAILNKKSQLFQYFRHQMQDIIQLGLLTLCLPEQGPSKSACTFFGNMAKAYPSELLPHVSALMRNIIHCIGTLTPRNHIDPFSDLLWKLGRTTWTEHNAESAPVPGPLHLSVWLKESLQESGFPSDLATPEVKEKFIKSVVKNYGHKRYLLEAVREFALSCRGLLGPYGDMTQPLDGF